ncbi:MAG: methionyl-tRNA formyltransferase [Thermoflexales bacterium]|nr:methionyl-tRNA formyltransferase [Thermoflexales bacterium]
MTRLIFMGTPEFAVPVLDKLVSAGAYEILAVYTQPDRPAGRGRKLNASPVKAYAAARALPVFQPDRLLPETQAELSALRPDVIVVAAYGLILRQAVLDLPPHGCINVHASLLPKYRGAAPIQAVLLDGERITGVTLMRMDAGVDTGPLLAQAELPIYPDDTSDTLSARLAELGADLLAHTLPAWLAGQIRPRAQDESQASLASRLGKRDGCLDWSRPAEELERRVRAFDPWPGTFTTWEGKRLKIIKAQIPSSKFQIATQGGKSQTSQPGQVVQWDSGVGVVTGKGVLELLRVQAECKCAMDAADFVCGHPAFVGAHLGQVCDSPELCA